MYNSQVGPNPMVQRLGEIMIELCIIKTEHKHKHYANDLWDTAGNLKPSRYWQDRGRHC